MRIKKILFICTAVFCILFCLCFIFLYFYGEEIFVTSGYKRLRDTYNHIQDGAAFTKEDIFNKLSYPDYYTNLQNESRIISFKEQETLTETLFQKEIPKWTYTTYKYSDPRDIYELEIYFDESGISYKAAFSLIRGG